MLSLNRLKSENIRLTKDPVPNVIAKPLPDNIYEWRFVIRGCSNTPYENGYYHGVLKFPPEYPLKPPAIKFITPSGRFATNQKICLSLSDFHPELWNPAWNIGSILIGVISFMNEDTATTGAIISTIEEKQAFAAASLNFNLRDKKFLDLFGADIVRLFEEQDNIIKENQTKLIRQK